MQPDIGVRMADKVMIGRNADAAQLDLLLWHWRFIIVRLELVYIIPHTGTYLGVQAEQCLHT